MRKICFITTTSITLKTFIIETAQRLHNDYNYHVTFICDKDEEFEKSLPSYINYIPVKMKRGINLDALKAIVQLKNIFDEEKFDMVQYSTPNASLYSSIAPKLTNIHLRLYGQWGIRYVGMKGINRKIFKLIEKMTCFFSTDIRAVSFKNLDFAVSEGLYKKNKAKVLGIGGTIGVPINHYDVENKQNYSDLIRKEYEIGNKFIFGFVGRFSRDKGSNELLEAFKEISDNYEATLLCIGPREIDSSIDNKLYEWAKSNASVVFTGSIPNKELKKYYAAMDCYVHPTHREGFGMVLQEAGAMGCTIITTDIPGASEVMENNISCLLVKPKDSEDLSKKMKVAIEKREIRENLGINARIRVEKYFDRELMIKNQLMDYEELLQANKRLG